MVLVIRTVNKVATEYGFTKSIFKTKLLVARLGLTNDDLAPLVLGGGAVEMVDQFKYVIGFSGGDMWWSDWLKDCTSIKGLLQSP